MLRDAKLVWVEKLNLEKHASKWTVWVIIYNIVTSVSDNIKPVWAIIYNLVTSVSNNIKSSDQCEW